MNSAVTRIRTWVFAAITQSTTYYTITAMAATCNERKHRLTDPTKEHALAQYMQEFPNALH